MSLQAVWRDAIDRIANSNDDGVSTAVNAERERIEQEEGCGQRAAAFHPPLANSIRQRHADLDIGKLRDFVTYLMWGKLTKNRGLDLLDPFLGIVDLEAYLAAWVPTRYEPSEVTAFVGSLGPPTKLGDLRSFLCARPAVKRQLYSHDQLDLFLLAEEIEMLRFGPPSTVGAGLNDKERKREIKRFQREPNHGLREVLFGNGWRGIPSSILGWAAIVTDQLMTGTCNCAEAFAQTPTAYRNAHCRCRDYHFLSRDNLNRAMRCQPEYKLYQQEKPISGPLKYVERAVIEKMLQTHHKHFAKTMFCNVFVTPHGNTLRLGSYWNGSQWTEGLTETGRDVHWDSGQWIERLTKNEDEGPLDVLQDFRCFGCPGCLSFIGQQQSYRKCIQERHFWCRGTIPREDPGQHESLVDGGTVKVSIRYCQSKHFWPAALPGNCPLCGQPPMGKPLRMEVFCPTNRTYDDVPDWRETLVH